MYRDVVLQYLIIGIAVTLVIGAFFFIFGEEIKSVIEFLKVVA